MKTKMKTKFAGNKKRKVERKLNNNLENPKNEIRILGVDDSPFKKEDSTCLVVACVFRGGSFMDGLLSCHVKIDGNDATEKLTKMINNSRHKDQLQIIMLDGIALGGFNVVDIQELARKTKLPVIVVINHFPDLRKIGIALKNVRNSQKKLSLIKKAGEIYSVKLKSKDKKSKGKIYMQLACISREEAEKIVKLSATRSLIPEPLRIAHLISSGIVLGESKGRA